LRGGRAPSENQVCLALHKERSPQGRRCRTKHHQPARRWLNGHVRALEHPAGCAAWVPALSAGPLLVAALLQGLRCCSGLRQCHPGHGSQQLLVGPIAQLAAHVALAAHAVCLLPLLLHPWTAGPAAWPAAHTATPSRLLAQSRRPCLLRAVAGPAGNKWRGRHPLGVGRSCGHGRGFEGVQIVFKSVNAAVWIACLQRILLSDGWSLAATAAVAAAATATWPPHPSKHVTPNPDSAGATSPAQVSGW